MRASNGAFSHFQILALPWLAFRKYLRIIADEAREERERRAREEQQRKFSRNPAMLKEYRQNINKWRKNQPPPWEVIRGGKD